MSSTESSSIDSRPKWAWFVILGVALLFLGLLALSNLLVATVASVFFVGMVMMIGGIGQIIHAFRVKSWSGFFFWLVSGLLYALAGFVAFYNPVLAAAAYTFVLAAILLASGVARFLGGLRYRPGSGWGWIVASGVVTVLVAILLFLGWPFNTLWLLGFILALDLTFQGVFTITFGFALKQSQ